MELVVYKNYEKKRNLRWLFGHFAAVLLWRLGN
jgi:hypothetical protein